MFHVRRQSPWCSRHGWLGVKKQLSIYLSIRRQNKNLFNSQTTSVCVLVVIVSCPTIRQQPLHIAKQLIIVCSCSYCFMPDDQATTSSYSLKTTHPIVCPCVTKPLAHHFFFLSLHLLHRQSSLRDEVRCPAVPGPRSLRTVWFEVGSITAEVSLT